MFQTLDTFDTIFSADSVEWCPAEGFEDVFVCGTYQLSPEQNEGLCVSNGLEKNKRVGRIYLFQVVNDEKFSLKMIQKLETSAILDMRWLQIKCFDGKILLGTVDSEGLLQVYELIKEEERLFLSRLSEISINDSENDVLALSLDCSPGNRDCSNNTDIRITVSDSEGSISLLRLEKNRIERMAVWPAHEYEAWITAFDYWNTNIIYTGGDDCKFLRFDSRMDPICPTTTNRSHNAGVTSLQSSWKNEFSFVSGSYDEFLRTWDLRSVRRPLAEIKLNGGIWRLKWDPYESRYLLAACMYNGFSVVDCEAPGDPKVVAEYKEHESIAYGCDWSFLGRSWDEMGKCSKEDESSKLVGTCSFYDHVLKLSSVKLQK